jgi:hypothetical protein
MFLLVTTVVKTIHFSASSFQVLKKQQPQIHGLKPNLYNNLRICG